MIDIFKIWRGIRGHLRNTTKAKRSAGPDIMLTMLLGLEQSELLVVAAAAAAAARDTFGHRVRILSLYIGAIVYWLVYYDLVLSMGPVKV
jgi:hypothetical protein